nr:uncharacterized protein CTRU02_13709 [Colletotrichum truncatum]KAF6783057.1 hypothetical protein CTRU02_13709 [Colletotrichum truncatum]
MKGFTFFGVATVTAEQELGKSIPLQECFDLIGGTGSGGIIALGLVSLGWDVFEATEKFETLVENAFSKRSGFDFSFWQATPTYLSENLEKGINLAFGSDGKLQLAESTSKQTISGKCPARVFVTASVSGQGGEVLSSYHRRKDLSAKETRLGPITHMLRAGQGNQLWHKAKASVMMTPASLSPVLHYIATPARHQLVGP